MSVAGSTRHVRHGKGWIGGGAGGPMGQDLDPASCLATAVCYDYLKAHDPTYATVKRRAPSIIIPTAGTSAPPASSAPAVVTAADVAKFLAATGEVRAEPRGWAVVGVPANFWVDVGVTVSEGRLLGAAADVRFTPQRYFWSYGDGATAFTTTSGASWAALHQAELTATATGHVYTARGARAVTVDVIYSAEYRVAGGGWLPVIGDVNATSPAAPVQVVREGTVLTASK